MKKRLLILPILAGFVLSGCDFNLESLMFWKKKDEQQQTDNDAKVTSVSITGSKTTIYVGETLQLGVNVVVEGSASKNVTWSTSNSAVATVSASGLVTPVSAGSVSITATSTFDTSKSASVSIKVVDKGPYPELYDDGYSYSKDFPKAAVKSFVGLDVQGFSAPEGFYVKHYDAESQVVDGQTNNYPEQVVIKFAYTEDNYDAVFDAFESYYSFYDPFYEVMSFMNTAQTIQFDLDYEYVSDDSYDYVFALYLYKVSDIYPGSSANTSDTAWSTDVSEALADLGISLPFIKLGADYDVEVDDGIYIYDMCSDYTKLDSYDSILVNSGLFEKVEDEDGTYYVQGLDKYTEAYVEFYFCGYGNMIEISTGLRKFAGYPGTEVAAFVDTLGSIYDVTEFTQNPEALYTYQEESDGSMATVGLFDVTEAQCNAYVEALVADEFVLDTENSYSKEDGTSAAFLQKGKIKVTAGIVYGSRDATEQEIEEFLAITEDEIDAMDWTEMFDYFSKLSELEETGTFQVVDYNKVSYALLMISGDPSAHELPGLYVESENVSVSLNGTTTLHVEAFKLGQNPVLTYVSSDESVATVSSAGVVTPVAEGTCDITVSTDYNEEHYEIVLHISVVNLVTDVITLSKLGRTETQSSTYANFSNVHDTSTAVYAGRCAAGNNAIQIRSKSQDSGVYSSTSGGTISSVTVTFSSADTGYEDGVKIVASNEPFTSVAALHSATVVATISNNSTTHGGTYVFEGSYQYVGVISQKGAHYIDSITFDWIPA